MTHRVFLVLGATVGALLTTPAGATTLDEAIAAAFAHAPVVAAADADRDAAAGRVTQARAAGLPSVTLNGEIGAGRLDPQNFFGLDAANVTPRSAQAMIEQPLFTGGRVGAGIREARAGAAAAAAAQTAVRADIAVAVAAAYGGVLVADRKVDLYRRLVEQTAEIERQATLKFRAGEVPSTDVSQAGARLAEARAGFAQAEGDRLSAYARYRNLVGVEPERLAPLAASPELPATLDEAVAVAADNSPAVAQAEAAFAAARSAARGAEADQLPTIGAYAEASTVRDQFFPDYSADGASVGIRARWRIFSGGLISGRISETSAAMRAAEARLRAARLQVEEQVVSAFHAIRTTTLVEQAAADQARASDQALVSIRHEVRVGKKPQLDLLDAEREAIAAATKAMQSTVERLVAAYRLNALLGRY